VLATTRLQKTLQQAKEGPQGRQHDRRAVEGYGGGAIRGRRARGEVTWSLPDGPQLLTTRRTNGTQKGIARWPTQLQTPNNHGCPGTPGLRGTARMASNRAEAETGKRWLYQDRPQPRFSRLLAPDTGVPSGHALMARSTFQDPVFTPGRSASTRPTWRRCLSTFAAAAARKARAPSIAVGLSQDGFKGSM